MSALDVHIVTGKAILSQCRGVWISRHLGLIEVDLAAVVPGVGDTSHDPGHLNLPL